MRIQPRTLARTAVAVTLLVLGASGCGGPGADPSPVPRKPSSASGAGSSATAQKSSQDTGSGSRVTGTQSSQGIGSGPRVTGTQSSGEDGDDISPVAPPPTDTGVTPDPSPELTDPPSQTSCEGVPTPAGTCASSREVTHTPLPGES